MANGKKTAGKKTSKNGVADEQIAHVVTLWSKADTIDGLKNAALFCFKDCNAAQRTLFIKACQDAGRKLPDKAILQEIANGTYADDQLKEIFTALAPAVTAGGQAQPTQAAVPTLLSPPIDVTAAPTAPPSAQVGNKRPAAPEIVIAVPDEVPPAALDMNAVMHLNNPEVKAKLHKKEAETAASKIVPMTEAVQTAREIKASTDHCRTVAQTIMTSSEVRGIEFLPEAAPPTDNVTPALLAHQENVVYTLIRRLDVGAREVAVAAINQSIDNIESKFVTAPGGFGGRHQIKDVKVMRHILCVCTWIALALTLHWPSDYTGIGLAAASVHFVSAVYAHVVPAYMNRLGALGYLPACLAMPVQAVKAATGATTSLVAPITAALVPRPPPGPPPSSFQIPGTMMQIQPRYTPFNAIITMCIRCGFIGKDRTGHTLPGSNTPINACHREHSDMNNVAFKDYADTFLNKVYLPEDDPVYGQSVQYFQSTKTSDNTPGRGGPMIPVVVDPRRLAAHVKAERYVSRMDLSQADKEKIKNLINRQRTAIVVPALGPMQGPEAAN